MKSAFRHLSPGTLAVVVLTLALFVLALFLKGFTHDLLLEAAVFLVSVKLIFLSYHNSASTEAIRSRLEEIYQGMRRMDGTVPNSRPGLPAYSPAVPATGEKSPTNPNLDFPTPGEAKVDRA